MVGQSYLQETPAPPSQTRRYLNQEMLPRLINMVAGIESIVERVGQFTRRRPATAIGLSFGGAFLLAQLGRRRGGT